jgi:carbamoyl-phosphate synthase large subunit
MPPDEVTIVVTGAGAPGIRGTLHCLRHNFDNVPVRVVGVDVDSQAVGRFFLDDFAQVPPPEDDKYGTAIVDLCGAMGASVIIPQTTRELAYFAAARSEFEAHGIQVVIASAEAIRRANNKLLTLQAFEAAGLPVPDYRLARTASAIEQAAFELGYPGTPVAVKPAVSNGMRGFRVLDETPLSLDSFLNDKPGVATMKLDELVAICREDGALPEMLVMEYLPGPEYSVDGFRGRAASIAVPRRRTRIRSGISFVTESVEHRELIATSMAGAEALGIAGIYGFQFKENHAAQPRLLECNPRVQGTMVAAYWAGANIVWMGVREALGYPVEAVPDINWDAVFHRYWGGVGTRDGLAVGEI